MNPGDSVTLNCEVKESSTGWRFSWYKTVPYRAGLPSLLDKSYSVEALSGYGTTEESYTLSPAGPTDTGGYVCRAGRGDPVYYTDYSEPQFLWSGDLPRASVKIVSPQEPLYTGDRVTLQCYIPEYTDWTYVWYKDKELLPIETSKTTTINLPNNAGQYQCQGKRTGRPQSSCISPNHPISVTALPTASVSVSPQGLLYSGETVTLQCDISDYTDWTYWWYRNELQSPCSASKTITSLSDQVSQYQCQGRRTDRPKSSQRSDYLNISVTVPGSSTSVLVGVVVGPVVAVVLLTIFLVLLCREKLTDPNEDSDYCEMKTVKITASSGPVDVTYAETDLKTMVIAQKMKESTSLLESESVYSPIKTQSLREMNTIS
ncbi:low affinity immunoglobulin gamma Fc region receptor II-like [Esox lucius]|uniref:low affinity immunoglobulin gamma Fc region receptor II-like n=1 Tax=Esox lucius TaxID=8010 RepID=UPI001476DC37|nr:low affinity immunoglobulin gamma Fc region receptor II-like [Esox lucius]